MELSIDTSTHWAGVALSHEGNLRAELLWFAGQNHTVELMSNIDRLFDVVNSDYSILHAIYIAIGPGSFNGLRAGISAAKGLAFSLSIPVIGVSSLEIEAFSFAFTGLVICPVHDAGRGELATARYQLQNTWTILEKEHIITVEELINITETKTVFCGEIPENTLQRIQNKLGEKAVIPHQIARLRHPANLACLGWQKLKSAYIDDIKTLQPIYLRQPPITQRKKKY
jgi:tRNA threonylcarbamoyladenosine biosynthesis protein TsaB